jgi:hypothetical protein
VCTGPLRSLTMQRVRLSRDLGYDPYEPSDPCQGLEDVEDDAQRPGTPKSDDYCEFAVHQQANAWNFNESTVDPSQAIDGQSQYFASATEEQGLQSSGCTKKFGDDTRAGSEEDFSKTSWRPPRPPLAETRSQFLYNQGLQDPQRAAHSASSTQQEQLNQSFQNYAEQAQQTSASKEVAASSSAAFQRPPRPTLSETTKLRGPELEIPRARTNLSEQRSPVDFPVASQADNTWAAKDYRSEASRRPPRQSLAELSAPTPSTAPRHFLSHPSSDQNPKSCQEPCFSAGRGLSSAAYQRPPRRSLTDTTAALNGMASGNLERSERLSTTTTRDTAQTTTVQSDYRRSGELRPPRPSLSESMEQSGASGRNALQASGAMYVHTVPSLVASLQGEHSRSVPSSQNTTRIQTLTPTGLEGQLKVSEWQPWSNGAIERQPGDESTDEIDPVTPLVTMKAASMNNQPRSTRENVKSNSALVSRSDDVQCSPPGAVGRPPRPSLGESSPAVKSAVRRAFNGNSVSIEGGEVERASKVREIGGTFPQIIHRSQYRPSLSETMSAPEHSNAHQEKYTTTAATRMYNATCT